MLNKNNERELAYLVRVDAITPMNADRLECAHIGGWHCVVGKGEFEVGDPAVYFEIDSQLPDREPFSSMEFLKSKHFKIKTQKIRGEISQGLLMPISAFGWQMNLSHDGCFDPVSDHDTFCIDDESRFLTKVLGVTYAVKEDNTRKASTNKYQSMMARHKTIFKTRFGKWMMAREWGRKLMFAIFGRKRDKRNDWPAWVVKTDEERIQNCPWMVTDSNKVWIPTEKIDGSSTTFTLKGKEFLVCSRNVAFTKPGKKCFYDVNIYTEMAEKYNMQEKLQQMLKDAHNEDHKVLFVTIQAETYGESVQKRDYGMKGRDMAIFNVIFGYKDGSTKRLNPIDGMAFAGRYGLPYVPVFTPTHLPTTSEGVVALADGMSALDGGMREGLVFRSEDGKMSFKAVSNEFLLKYHG